MLCEERSVTPARLKAALPALGKMNPRWLRIGEHRDLGKRVLESFRLKDTITPVDSEVYDSIGGHKHSLDQDTYPTTTLEESGDLRLPFH